MMTELSSQLGLGENQVPAGLQLLLQTHLVIDSYLVPAFFFSRIERKKKEEPITSNHNQSSNT